MFDLNADDGSVRKRAYKSPIPEAPDPRPVSSSRLDNAKYSRLHGRLVDLYTRELDRQFENRMDQAQDADFYDGLQWRPEDAKVLQDRGQVPLVYNVISASIDWVTGTEKRSRTDFKILPRRKEDGTPAERKTQLLKYLSDVNRSDFHRSRAFEDAVKVGIGWLEDGVEADSEEEPIYSRYESWRNMLWDSAATEPDLKDARYIFRTKWVDLDVAMAMFPTRRDIVARSAADNDDYIALDAYGDEAMDSQEIAMDMAGQSMTSDRINGYQRQRVRLIEAWIRLPTNAPKMRGGMFAGELFDPLSPGHKAEVQEGEADVVTGMTMRMHVAILTTAGLLYVGPSPYRHNRFPFTPIWAYRRDRDNLPYGMVRRVKDIQEDVNKRASKALHILSTNKIVMDDDALPEGTTPEEFLEEASRPDALLLKKKGSELVLNADRDLSQWHLELMSRSISMIQQASGVTDELLGRKTNATSGIAIQRRQDQGSLATAKLFDNLLFANQVQGENQLSLVEQFMTEKKAFRITNMRGTPEYVEINDGLPENDVTRTKADFVVSETDWHSTLRQAAVDSLLEVMTRLPPQVSIVLLDLVVENMDLPNRDEIVRRIRAATGQRDPDQQEPTPEEIQQQQLKSAMDQITMAKAIGEVKKLGAEIAEKQAKIAEIESKLPSNRVDAQQKALAAAVEAIAVPPAAHIADHILAESGFVAQSDKDKAAIGLNQPPPGGSPAPAPSQPPSQEMSPGQSPGQPVSPASHQPAPLGIAAG